MGIPAEIVSHPNVAILAENYLSLWGLYSKTVRDRDCDTLFRNQGVVRRKSASVVSVVPLGSLGFQQEEPVSSCPFAEVRYVRVMS